MRVLGIESSCDETAIALVEKQGDHFTIVKAAIASQIITHAFYGGVVPEVAAREHAELVFPLLEQLCLPRDGQSVDVIAVTYGPGLIPALRVGVEFGKVLAWIWQKPLVRVNHLEGHIYSVWPKGTPVFPALCLLVSGGHTELILMKDHGVYEHIGMTRDDAAGEAFDKVAKLLGLCYPGGPEIVRAADAGDPNAIAFPRPMLETDDFDFSFSGLKTAVRREVEQGKWKKEDVAASFQAAVIETLVKKTIRAVFQYHPQSVILSGGVSANRLLRQSLKDRLSIEQPRISFFAPDFSLTGDNAVMIAIAGAYLAERRVFVDPLFLQADPNARLI